MIACSPLFMASRMPSSIRVLATPGTLVPWLPCLTSFSSGDGGERQCDRNTVGFGFFCGHAKKLAFNRCTEKYLFRLNLDSLKGRVAGLGFRRHCARPPRMGAPERWIARDGGIGVPDRAMAPDPGITPLFFHPRPF